MTSCQGNQQSTEMIVSQWERTATTGFGRTSCSVPGHVLNLQVAAVMAQAKEDTLHRRQTGCIHFTVQVGDYLVYW